MFRMSRDSRKIFQLLDDMAVKYNVQCEISPVHIHMCEIVMMKYNVMPVVNILKSRIQSVKQVQDKHVSFEYWFPVIANMLKNNNSAVRKNWTRDPVWFNSDTDAMNAAIAAFSVLIGNYLLTDYSYSDMMIVMELSYSYALSDITKACDIGRNNKVYDVKYIRAIVEKERMKRVIEDQVRATIQDKVRVSTDKINKVEVHRHTPLDIAGAVGKWNQAIENAKLEKKFNDMMSRLDMDVRRDRQ